MLDVEDKCSEVDGFDAELRCVEAVQKAVSALIPDTTCAFERGESGHTAGEVVERGYGCCYDRATLIEQALREFDFEVRRVAIYERQSNPLMYLVPGISSHALSEVKTERGWVAVESLDPLQIGVDDENRVYDVPALREALQSDERDARAFGGEEPDDFFSGRDFAYIYGVYSRHGFFFEPHIPVPEVEWATFGW